MVRLHRFRNLLWMTLLLREAAGVLILYAHNPEISSNWGSERVAQEQCCELGDTIGYQIRMDKNVATNRLTFVTTGILLRRLHGDRNKWCYTYNSR